MGRRLACLPSGLRRTLTLDNGKEFAAGSPGTRRRSRRRWTWRSTSPPRAARGSVGTSENTNGLLRQFFPKGTDFAAVTGRRVARVEALLNDRPRKRLGYRTPTEVLKGRLCCD